MKRVEFVLSGLLVAVLAMPVATVFAQQSSTDSKAGSEATEAERAASEAAAAEGEEAERREEEAARRRRMPSETTIDLGDGRAIRVSFFQWPVDGRDYPQLGKLKPGEVLPITASAPPKLWTHVDLMFGDLAIKKGNVAENYPGVYGLWLKKTETGWNLVLNNKPDVWGTMYDPAADAGEVALEYAMTDSKGDRFSAELENSEAGHGVLHLMWGEYRWSVPFTYGG